MYSTGAFPGHHFLSSGSGRHWKSRHDPEAAARTSVDPLSHPDGHHDESVAKRKQSKLRMPAREQSQRFLSQRPDPYDGDRLVGGTRVFSLVHLHLYAGDEATTTCLAQLWASPLSPRLASCARAARQLNRVRVHGLHHLCMYMRRPVGPIIFDWTNLAVCGRRLILSVEPCPGTRRLHTRTGHRW